MDFKRKQKEIKQLNVQTKTTFKKCSHGDL